MRKILLLLFFTTSYWQVNAQCNLKIATTTPTLCEGQNVSMTATGVPTNATLQWKKNGTDIDKAVAATYQTNSAGTYSVKTIGKDAVWNKINLNEELADLRKTFFVNAQIGWTIEEKGVIKKTTDGGITWTKQSSSTTNELYSLYFLDANKGFIVGNNNTILRTTNGGTIWTQVTIPTLPSSWNYSQPYLSVYFLNQNVGWISASLGVTLKTTDGGNTWKAFTINDTYVSVIQSTFIDDNTGFAIDYYGGIHKTTDNGVTWKVKYARSDGNYCNSIFFQNTKVGWAVGYGFVLNTIDGGETWIEKKGFDLSSNLNLLSVLFTDTKTGYIFDRGGIYHKTIDGGTIWTKQSTGLRVGTNGVSFIDNNNGWIVGSNGTIIKTDDGGKTWKSLIKGNPIFYSGIYFVNNQTGYRVGSFGYIAKTTDGGTNWTEQKSNEDGYISDIKFFDSNTGWATSYYSSSVLKTTDGGTTWEKKSLKPLNYPTKIFFTDNKNGIAVGDKNVISRTTDGGNTWTLPKHTWDTTWKYAQLNDIYFVDGQNGWAVGNNVVLNTTDKGVTWNQVNVANANGNMGGFSVFFTDKLNGYILQSGGVSITTDGGKTWTSTQIASGNEYLQSISFVNSKVGYILGSVGTIWSTNDAGKTWLARPPLSSKYMFSLFALDANNIWAVGGGETMLKYEFPTLCNSNQLTINPKPAAPTVAWSNTDAKLTATSTSAGTLAWLKGTTDIPNVTTATYQPTSSGSYSVRVTDANGCTEVSKAVEVTILSSENPMNDSGVNVFPNPSSNGIFKVAYTRFSNEMEASMQIIGLDGMPLNSQKMVRQNNVFEGEINASNLATGIYFLQVVSGEQKAVVKISIAK